MHCPAMLDGNIEASPLRGRGDHPVPVGCESELRISNRFCFTAKSSFSGADFAENYPSEWAKKNRAAQYRGHES
jgi:hypothetical protein